MTKSLRFNLMFLLALLTLLPAAGQTRRTGAVNPLSPDRSSYSIVYEFEQVDVQPEFPGGEHGLVNFINKTREYPYQEYVRHIQGRVLMSFIIGTDGRVCHVEVLRSSGNEALDREATRVIKRMPKWKCGQMADEKVNVRCILPIAFRL